MRKKNEYKQLLDDEPEEQQFQALARDDAKTEIKVIPQPAAVLIDIRPVYQPNSPLINDSNPWVSRIPLFLDLRDLINLSYTCRFFANAQTPLFLDNELKYKHTIVKLSVTLAKEYAKDKVRSQVAAGGEYAEYTDADRKEEKRLAKQHVADLLNNNPLCLQELRRYYTKEKRCITIATIFILLFFIMVIPVACYQISLNPKDILQNIAYGYCIVVSLSILFCCFKCGPIRNIRKLPPQAKMIDTIQQCFLGLKSKNILPANAFPDAGPTRTELREMKLL